MAGAHEYADKKDTLVSHGHADKMAKKYINGEYKNLKNDEDKNHPIVYCCFLDAVHNR